MTRSLGGEGETFCLSVSVPSFTLARPFGPATGPAGPGKNETLQTATAKGGWRLALADYGELELELGGRHHSYQHECGEYSEVVPGTVLG